MGASQRARWPATSTGFKLAGGVERTPYINICSCCVPIQYSSYNTDCVALGSRVTPLGDLGLSG